MTDAKPYARVAFVNPYNLSVFLGGIAAGLLSGHHAFVVLTCGAEALWMIFAPDSAFLRSVWFDRALAAGIAAAKQERREAKVALLAPPDRARVAELTSQKAIIEQLARENPSLGVELLHGELRELDALVEEFADLGAAAMRAEARAATFDFAALDRSWQAFQTQHGAFREGDPRRAVARKNLDVLRRRRQRFEDLRRTIQVTRGQMELIEQTFRLLGDEIVSMASPREIGGRIEELRVAVEAVRETADENEAWDALDEEMVGHDEANR